MSYKVEFHPGARKSFLALPAHIRRRLSVLIDKLAGNPRPNGCRKLSDRYDDLYRLRSGDYRIVYQIKDDILIVYVLRIGKRDEIYRGLISSRRK